MSEQIDPNIYYYPPREKKESEKIFKKRGGFFTRLKSKIITLTREESTFYILTILLPGLGHFILRELKRGVLFLCLFIISLSLTINSWNQMPMLFWGGVLFTIHSYAIQDISMCFSRRFKGSNSINWRQVFIYMIILLLIYAFLGRIFGAQVVLFNRRL